MVIPPAFVNKERAREFGTQVSSAILVVNIWLSHAKATLMRPLVNSTMIIRLHVRLQIESHRPWFS